MMSQSEEQEPQNTLPQHNLHCSAVVFDPSLVKKLSCVDVRIPPNYIGVRRVRPSSREVAAKLLGNNSTTEIVPSKVVFKVKDEHGNERRMTAQEKKAMKYAIAQEKKKAKKKRALEESTTEETESKGMSSRSSLPSVEQEKSKEGRSYHQLPLNPAELEKELAELRGERSGLPPVLLSPALVVQAGETLTGNPAPTTENSFMIRYDEKLSQEWAKAIKESMLPAEKTRDKEDLRQMAYQLTPEPWRRVRTNYSETPFTTSIYPKIFDSPSPSEDQTKSTMTFSIKKCGYSALQCRPPNQFDLDCSVIFGYLHHETSFFVSCGAKFGSDFLVYDGPREERHAFAGMRVFTAPNNKLPLPTAYSLAGYARCLNKAGKLALLATVVHDEVEESNVFRVAFVDVALEKVLTAPTHQKRARTEKRRDITQNLSKK